MSDSTVKVFVEEEYGYRYWMWDTLMTPEALIAWWQGLQPDRVAGENGGDCCGQQAQPHAEGLRCLPRQIGVCEGGSPWVELAHPPRQRFRPARS